MPTIKYTEDSDSFKKGECVCPHCGFDHENYEHGADFMELPGIDSTYCTNCEKDFEIQLEFKITTLKLK